MQEAWFYKMTSKINLFNLVPSFFRGRHGFGQSHPEPGWLWPQPKTSSEWNRLSQVGQEWTLIYPLDLSTTFKPKKTAELLSVLQNLTKIPKNWSKSPRATVSVQIERCLTSGDEMVVVGDFNAKITDNTDSGVVSPKGKLMKESDASLNQLCCSTMPFALPQ